MADKRKQRTIRRDRRRRGAGIEMAMLLMVVAVALGALLTSVAMMQINKQKSSGEQLEQRMALDQIGREFCERRARYDPPDGEGGYDGSIVCEYDTEDGNCPGCCSSCAECNEIYADDTESGEGGDGDGSGESIDDTETGISRPECCAECGCTRGCTGFSEISLVVTSDFDEVVLTVVLANNQDGTYTVAEWSYGE